jgi:hypothetical protein
MQMAEKSKSSMKDSIERARENFFKGFQNSIKNIKNEKLKSTLIANYQTLIKLIDEDKDSIWTYIIKNVYKPIALTNLKVDVILGNPPWITMQGMKNQPYQQFLKKATFDYNLLDKNETHQFTHMELATLFFCLVTDLYLKENGKIGFVMPKSILFSSHHKKFIKFEKPKFGLDKIFDAEQVTPLFNVPCCVIMCTKGKTTSYPVQMITISGKLTHKNASLEEAIKSLRQDQTKFEPATLDTTASFYYDKFYQGATMFPRNFYFVTIVKDPFLGINPHSPKVKSNEDNETKPPWTDVVMEDEVESNFLYASLIGEKIVPFGKTEFSLTVLPIFVADGQPHVIKNYEELQTRGFPKAAAYFQTAESKWAENATEKSSKMTPYDRLDYRKGVENQNLRKKYKILYVSSSTYLASCVINMMEPTSYTLNGNKIPLNGFIAESKTYWFETDIEDEAYYLSAILNSKIIDELIKPLQTHGLWGERDIHKRPLMLPIPRFSKSNVKHKKLTELGKLCHEKVPNILSKIESKSIGKIRTQIRNSLSEEMSLINKLTKEVLMESDSSVQSYLN